MIMALLVSSIPVKAGDEAEDTIVDPSAETEEIIEVEEPSEEIEDPSEEEKPSEEDDHSDKKKDSHEDDQEAEDSDSDITTDEEILDESAGEEVSEDPESDDEWMSEHKITKRSDGTYEEIDEDGNRTVIDPDDPEFYKFYKNSKKELIPLNRNFSETDSFLSDDERPDPFTCRLTGFKYSYPSYYKTNDASKRARIRYGMDISKYQGVISYENWKILKDTYGIEFAFIRAGYRGWGSAGNIRPDECFDSNIVNARKAGVQVGVYFYSQAITPEEGEEEAVKCLSYIGSRKDLVTLPVVIDYEYSDSKTGRLIAAKLSRKAHTDIVNAFCKKIAESGLMPGIYASRSMLVDDMILSDIAKENNIWMANWPSSTATVKSTSYTGRLCSWQYTDSFSGFGDKGKKLMKSDALDLDFWFGDFPGEEHPEDDETIDPSIPVEEPDPEEEEKKEEPRKEDEQEEDSDTFVVSGVEDREYTGSPITFEDLTVKRGKTVLQPDSDYTVKYSNNTRVGTGRVAITGKGNYSGTFPVKFKINPIDITGRIEAKDISLSYTGRVQKGTTDVSLRLDDGTYRTLKSGTDFKFVYPDGLTGDKEKDCRYTIQIVGKGNYEGTASFTETILKKETDMIPIGKLSVSRIKNQQPQFSDSGSLIPVKPELVVKYKGQTVDEGCYELEYVNNTAPGTASVFMTGKGNVTGSRKIDFKISSLPLSKASITGIESTVTYTSYPVKQTGYELRYGSDDTLLVEGRDYEVSYSNNINSGRSAAITFTGIGAYSGSVRKLFSIESASLSEGSAKNPAILVIMRKTVPFAKGGAKPAVKVIYTTTDGEYTLIENEDYTLSYENNTSVNDGTKASKRPGVYITGKGNFTGKLYASYAITAANIAASELYVSDIISSDTDSETEPDIVVFDSDKEELERGTDYDCSINGTEVTITGTGNYYGEKSSSFRYAQKSIEGAAVKIADKPYTGSPVTLSKEDITMLKVGQDLLNENDYEIIAGSYENNISIGKASVKIRGLGEYGGIKTIRFKIVKKKIKQL
ncbi:MAG: hypothetical protein J5367_02680 [Lachnospiraceae bacterium]|nr:hypothetical protein [Lachnospiraceae bacterium]